MVSQPHPISDTSPDSAGSDVLVIGGGVIGLAIAWRAAQRGMRVALADPEPGRGASHAAAGMLTPVAEAAYAERELFELGSLSLRRYPEFAAELADMTGRQVGYRQTGTLQVAYDADDMALLDEHALLRESFGVPTHRLTGRECRKAEPLLGPAIRGGLLVDDDASVDPRLLTAALLAAARSAGVTHLPYRVNRLITRGDRACGADLADGTAVSARQVVLAAGWASGAMAGLPDGAVPPLRPVKGQTVRLRPTAATRQAGPTPSLLTRTVRGLVQGSSVYLVPRDDGELVIGATQEEIGADLTVTAGGVWQLLRDSRALVPGITELELAESVAGLRPGTPDNAPVIGPSALPGLVLATGHFRAGVLLAPVTADLIAEFLRTGALPSAASPFSASRFARPDVTSSEPVPGAITARAGAGTWR
ncbi:MAG TPA: glycine oxidase ThiO [Streptosporangiaceae bacterium]|nr:glycine oxidase ThiO [Streptosporangiaceae bacterium]